MNGNAVMVFEYFSMRDVVSYAYEIRVEFLGELLGISR